MPVHAPIQEGNRVDNSRLPSEGFEVTRPPKMRPGQSKALRNTSSCQDGSIRQEMDDFPGGMEFDRDVPDPLADLSSPYRKMVDWFVAFLFTREEPDPRCRSEWN
jgi:hypothetical protein